MKRNLLILVIFSLFLVFGQTAFSQEEAPVVISVPITISKTQMKEDDRGTDVDNIYTVTVERTDNVADGATYNVLYYLDDRYVEEFKHQTLPFSFTRNFKGQTDTAHDIRIDLEDQNLAIVGRQVMRINVAHPND